MSVEAILSAYTHRGTRTHVHSDYTKLNLHSLKTGSKRRLEMDGDSSMDQKTWQVQVHSFGKRNVFRLHWNESREGFSRRGRGRSFYVNGPKTEKSAGTNSGECIVRGIWRLRVSEAERRVREGV